MMTKLFTTWIMVCVFYFKTQGHGHVLHFSTCIASHGLGWKAYCPTIPKPSILHNTNVTELEVQGEIPIISKQFKDFRSTNIENLNLSRCGIQEIKPNAFSSMNKLLTLALSNNKLELIDEEIFRNLTILENLLLDGNGIKVILEGSFQNLKNLQVLNLANNELLEIPSELPNSLKELDFQNNAIQRLSMENLRHLIRLEVLNACGNEISTWPGENNLLHLKSLCIGERIINSGGKHPSFKNIDDLHISASHLTNAPLNRTIQDVLESLTNLKTMHIGHYEIDSFAFLTKTPLRRLTLENIDYMGKELTAFPTNLTELTISQSPELGKHVLNFRGIFERLIYLNLRNNGIKEIAEVHSTSIMRTVKYLDISSNPINCQLNKWLWLFEKFKNDIEEICNFLLKRDEVKCSEPLHLRGRTLVSIVKNYGVFHKDVLTIENYTKTESNTTNKINTEDFKTTIPFISVLVCFSVLMVLCTYGLYKLFKEKSGSETVHESTSPAAENNSSRKSQEDCKISTKSKSRKICDSKFLQMTQQFKGVHVTQV